MADVFPVHSSEAGWAVDESIEALYELQTIVGAGVYGTVHRARDRATGETVAVKHVSGEEETGQGVPTNILREVSCLRDFCHPNVVKLLDIHITSGEDFYLIFEYMEKGDLSHLLKHHSKTNSAMPLDSLKRYSYDLLNGLHACHQRCILHRDLKPKNILLGVVNGKDTLKIADFGLARNFTVPLSNYTSEVITLWYRAPELLLGAQSYGAEVDMWSAGCIIAEMATNQPTFPGDSEIGTVFVIFKKAGTPSEDSWPGVSSLMHWKTTFPRWPPTDFAGIYDARAEIGPDGLDLIKSLLCLSPSGRHNARQAKSSSFFTAGCEPTHVEKEHSSMTVKGRVLGDFGAISSSREEMGCW